MLGVSTAYNITVTTVSVLSRGLYNHHYSISSVASSPDLPRLLRWGLDVKVLYVQSHTATAWEGLGTRVTLLLDINKAHHSEHSSWFLQPEDLNDLEDVHHTLRLTLLNGGRYGTEHPRTTHRVTERKRRG